MGWTIKRVLSYAEVSVTVKQIGVDYCIEVQGGERSHIGTVVMTVPRPSLTGSGKISVTSSVINVTGHKDEQICRYLAEQTAQCSNAVVVCTGGFHIDNITDRQLQEVLECVRDIGDEIKGRLEDIFYEETI